MHITSANCFLRYSLFRILFSLQAKLQAPVSVSVPAESSVDAQKAPVKAQFGLITDSQKGGRITDYFAIAKN
jgi:hypothetical protein